MEENGFWENLFSGYNKVLVENQQLVVDAPIPSNSQQTAKIQRV